MWCLFRDRLGRHSYWLSVLILFCSLSGGACKQNNRFAAASDRLEKTQLQKDIRRLEEMLQTNPGHPELISERARLRRELATVQARLDNLEGGASSRGNSGEGR